MENIFLRHRLFHLNVKWVPGYNLGIGLSVIENYSDYRTECRIAIIRAYLKEPVFLASEENGTKKKITLAASPVIFTAKSKMLSLNINWNKEGKECFLESISVDIPKDQWNECILNAAARWVLPKSEGKKAYVIY